MKNEIKNKSKIEIKNKRETPVAAPVLILLLIFFLIVPLCGCQSGPKPDGEQTIRFRVPPVRYAMHDPVFRDDVSELLPPSGSVGAAVGSHSVTLAWNASPDTSITGYNLYYGELVAAMTNKLNVGVALTATVSNLVEDTEYVFAATAYDAVGMESEFSNLVSYRTPNLPPAPPSELRIVITPQTATSPTGPWLAVAGWPALTLTNPAGNRFYRYDITPLQLTR